MLAPGEAARVGIVSYSPANVSLVAQKLTRKILADYGAGRVDRIVATRLRASWCDFRG
jgi:hypothetical protein